MTVWRRSTRCDSGHCVEVAFHKSSHSATNISCVEAGACACGVLVRDSKDPDGPVLTFGAAAWAAFLTAVQDGVMGGD